MNSDSKFVEPVDHETIQPEQAREQALNQHTLNQHAINQQTNIIHPDPSSENHVCSKCNEDQLRELLNLWYHTGYQTALYFHNLEKSTN